MFSEWWCTDVVVRVRVPVVQAVTPPHPVQRLTSTAYYFSPTAGARPIYRVLKSLSSHVFNYVRLHVYQQTARGRQVQCRTLVRQAVFLHHLHFPQPRHRPSKPKTSFGDSYQI